MDNISWKWVAISALIFLVCEIALGIVFGIISILSFGLLGWLLKPTVYLIGAFIAGYVSKGITIKEPAIAAAGMVILGSIFNSGSNLIWILVTAGLAFVCALIGATAGERYQARKAD